VHLLSHLTAVSPTALLASLSVARAQIQSGWGTAGECQTAYEGKKGSSGRMVRRKEVVVLRRGSDGVGLEAL